MKKLMACIMTAFLSLTFISTQTKAASEVIATSITATKTAESEKATALITRLNEINAMDKSKLNSSEKKQLRKEVRDVKKQLNSIGGGVYISVGAIIIILLLLIILL